MAHVSIKAILVTSLILGLLAAKVLCSPESDEDSSKYLNDEEGEDEDDVDEDNKGETALPPVMKSQPQNLEVHSGVSVVLPCATENHEYDAIAFAITWMKDGRTLYLDGVQGVPKDTRLTYNTSDSSLVITNITTNDAGHYYCSYSSHPPVQLKHVINVFAPAVIRGIQPSWHVSVEKGNAVTLKCSVTGYPRPVVEWKKLGKNQHHGTTVIVTSENMTLDPAGRLDSGTYECTAKNNRGPEVAAQANVRVIYAPEIDIEEKLVTSGTDYETKLKCVVHAEPKADVYWLKDDAPVRNSSRVRIFMEGNRHYYHISKTQVSDFGKYKCVATNQKNTTVSEKIELTGSPSAPRLIMANVTGDGRSLDIEWHIISYSPILKYEVKYKNTKGSGKWEVLQPPVEETDGNVYKLKYQLKNLAAGDFVVSLSAANFIGSTESSEPHSFTIKSESIEATAESSTSEGGRSANDSTRPRITTALMIVGFCALFL